MRPPSGGPAPSADEHPLESILGVLSALERRNAPRSLFCRGDAGLLTRGRRVSVVGAREASEQGKARARRLARLLAGEGLVVMSGLALGIDTAAHEATLAAGGRTIAVLGTPLERCYPAANRDLQARIAREHLLVSQFPPGTPVQRNNFPRRNLTMALLSAATIIVEASDRSGALHQGREALRLGRDVLIPRSVADDPALRWPTELQRLGAHAFGTSAELLAAVTPRKR